ncbi:lipopolysaccharide biosynthesis protein [Mesonia mobilis]|uniref:lipopolysaccharide biosynthesis protein n=1 Tax=Mesonia mobilis TaxID=369791 RepID=UPI0024B9A519|nr:polysaccharide biosynthesis C-terminal domain-containing protein [Mesonia mobilis]
MLQRLFKQTFIYGLATVLPRILTFLLTPFFITQLKSAEDYGVYSLIMAFMVLGNVVLSYGMETAFFRFINKKENSKEVLQTGLTSLFGSTLIFCLLGYLFANQISALLEINLIYIRFIITILSLDALVVIPFAALRQEGRSIRYGIIKIINVVINVASVVIFFLVFAKLNPINSNWITNILYQENKVHYIFTANTIASFVTFLVFIPMYFKTKLKFNVILFKQMFRYALPILIAGIAFSVNEVFDKIILKYLLPDNIAEKTIGIYAACYKMGVFMSLFITAFKLGVEPFFFHHAEQKNAKKTYADITLYFTILGSFILLFILVYTDWLKYILIPNKEYWEALVIVPFILLGNLCLGIYHNLSVWYKVSDQTNYGAIISSLGAIITLTLNFWLIPEIGYKGAAIATLAAYSVMMFTSYLIGRKKYPIPYNLKSIGLYLVLSIAFGFTSFYIFNRNILIGTLLLFLFLGIVYIKEKKELLKILQA